MLTAYVFKDLKRIIRQNSQIDYQDFINLILNSYLRESYQHDIEWKFLEFWKIQLKEKNANIVILKFFEYILFLRSNLTQLKHLKEIKYHVNGMLLFQIKVILFNDQ